MDRYSYGTLKDCLSRRNWADSNDTVMTVGYILKDEYVFEGVDDVFEYFDKPWHWETDMRKIVIDYEYRHVIKDFQKLSDIDAITALSWLDKFGYELKVIDDLETDLSERELCPA